MKIFFAASILAAVNATNVHPFFAESNFACGICQQALTHGNKGNWEELSQLYQLFPALEEKISSFEGNADLIDLTKPELSCQHFGLCARETVAEMLLAEMPVDLDQHIEYVNNHPNATWTARANDKWTGASKKEIQ